MRTLLLVASLLALPARAFDDVVGVSTFNGSGITGPVHGIAVKQPADATITGTTTASSASAIVGSGTKFTTELAMGDLIAVSSAASTFAQVSVITDDTHLTVLGSLGNGTSQTIIRRPAPIRVEDANVGVGFFVNRGRTHLFDSIFTSTTFTGPATFNLRNVGGTRTSPTASNDTLYSIDSYGWNTSALVQSSRIVAQAGSAFSGTNRETYLAFYTTPSGSTSVTERFRIRADGLLSLSTAYTASSIPIIDGSRVIQARLLPTTCQLDGQTPSQCTITVTTGSTVCWCSNKGSSAAIAALGCAWSVSGTTLTITSAAAANHDVSGGCY